MDHRYKHLEINVIKDMLLDNYETLLENLNKAKM